MLCEVSAQTFLTMIQIYSHEQLWWRRKRTEIIHILREKRDNLTKEAKEKLHKCSTWMGSLLVGVGTALQVASIVFTIVGKFGGYCPSQCVISTTRAVGKKMNSYGIKLKKHGNKNRAEVEQLLLKANDSEKLMNKLDKIHQSFYRMTQDAAKMDKLFSDFVMNISNPHKKGHAVIDNIQRNGNKVNLMMLQLNIKSIIKSFETLQITSNEILKTINNAQDTFNSN